jgi:hypothetical protein
VKPKFPCNLENGKKPTKRFLHETAIGLVWMTHEITGSERVLSQLFRRMI